MGSLHLSPPPLEKHQKTLRSEETDQGDAGEGLKKEPKMEKKCQVS